MLEVTDLTVEYDGVLAVDGISFSVRQGEVVALLGANGAGKSSAMWAVSRSIASTGVIRFDGEHIRRLTPERVARRGLVLCPENRRIFGNLTVEENLRVGALARRGRSGFGTVDTVYELFPQLVPLRDRHGWALSGGEQQMLAIGRALMGAPRCLMFDEPSLGLSPRMVQIVYGALDAIRGEIALLIVEQQTSLVLSMCDRGYVMAGGRIQIEGAADYLRSHESLVTTYLGINSANAKEH